MYQENRDINEKKPNNLLGKKNEFDATEKNIAHHCSALNLINFLIRSQKTLLEANNLESTIA